MARRDRRRSQPTDFSDFFRERVLPEPNHPSPPRRTDHAQRLAAIAHTTVNIEFGHGWRRGWDSNPRETIKPLLAFEASSFNHSDTSPLTRPPAAPLARWRTSLTSRGWPNLAYNQFQTPSATLIVATHAPLRPAPRFHLGIPACFWLCFVYLGAGGSFSAPVCLPERGLGIPARGRFRFPPHPTGFTFGCCTARAREPLFCGSHGFHAFDCVPKVYNMSGWGAITGKD